MEAFLPLLLIMGVMLLPMLFLSSRQRKMQQRHLEMVNKLGVGDEVRTHSGFFGLIVETYDDVVILESEDGSQSKWARQAIAAAVDPQEGTDQEALGAEESDAVESADADQSAETTLTEPDAEGSTGTAREGEVPGVTTSPANHEAERRQN
ncbi:preprotein translocase subunit YajC [Brachybacterium sp. UMB0905]|uniref:preprotein translocase subunit YajC n=1 Tax=Brachybacterium sp. UMB0905 TaxID=2069310 RepID=UPI001E3F957A|nr:preprotein translocase subunit YajC [Brachybacterium sp. UMB0905]